MAGAFVAAAQAGDGQTATVTQLTLTIPAGAASGQRALVFVNSSDSGMAFDTITSGGAGSWSVIDGPRVNGTSAATAVLEKVLTAGDPGSTLTVPFTSAAARADMTLLGFSGTASTGASVVAVAQDASSVSSYTLPTTAATAGSVQVAAFLRRRVGVSPGSVTVPAPYTAPAAPGGSPATAYGSGVNVFIGTGYVTSSAGGTVGGESGSTATTSVGTNYLVLVPVGAASGVGTLAVTGSGAVSFSGKPAVPGTLTRSGAGALSISGKLSAADTLARDGTGTATFGGKAAMKGALTVTGVGVLAFVLASGFLARTGTGVLVMSGTGASVRDLTVTFGPVTARFFFTDPQE